MGPDALASLAMAKMQMAARHITSKKERRQVVKLAKERIMKDVAKRHKRSPASVHKKHVAATEHKTGSVGHHKKKAVAKQSLEESALAKMMRTAQSIRSPAERARVIALARRKITALVKKRAQTALRKSHHKDIEKPKMVKPDALASLAMAKMQMAARHITSKKERRQVVKLAKGRIMKDVAKRHKRS